MAKQKQSKGEAEATSLEVFLEAKVTRLALRFDGLDAIFLGLVLSGAGHDTSLLVITHTLLEEVGLARERDVLHEVEGVGGVVDLGVAKSQQQAVSDKLDVLAHEGGVHAEQSTGKSLSEELLLNLNGLGDDGLDGILARARVEEREKQAGKVGVHALVTRDELVGEGKTRHQTTLLEPEDGRERAAEEDTLDSSKGDKAVGKGGVLV